MNDRDRYGYERAPRRSSMGSSEEPPNSRLFVIGPKSLTEDDYRKAFSEFGRIEELWVVKDRQTGESKGVTYIKYSKTTEAAKAMDEMNGKTIGNTGRNIKIMVAASREQGSKRDQNEEEKTLRLFVLVPKDLSDNELYDHFEKFGEIDYAHIIRDKNSRESKGFAYVKYFKFYHAALAYEQCDKKYKPVFAEPRKPNLNKEERRTSSFSSVESTPSRNSVASTSTLLPPPTTNVTDRFTKLKVIASPQVNQDQLWKLFDIIPGMDYCVLKYDEEHNRPTRAIGEVVYTNPQWAAHAVEKLHGFEYPPGFRLIVKPDLEGKESAEAPNQDLLRIAETIAKITQLINSAGLSPDLLGAKLGIGITQNMETDSMCNRSLPATQPLADIDSSVAARCFIVCSPTPLPNTVLRDIFCRFGDLIEVYLLGHKNCGYAKFASKSSAENAIATLHGAEVMGVRLKVMEAEERSDQQRKRMKVDDE